MIRKYQLMKTPFLSPPHSLQGAKKLTYFFIKGEIQLKEIRQTDKKLESMKKYGKGYHACPKERKL